jgi:hypothetical protein
VADSAFLTPLRTSDGPSHLLLVLLNQHRVMTTGQLARATDTPERTVRYRLDRLHHAGLIAYARPGRESGSAPRHWWLRPTGARLVAGTAAAEGKPSAMFAAHAAAITEVWLALSEHGPAHGITVEDWLTDRAGWQEWEAGTYWSRRYRLTPDAVAHVRMPDGSPAVAFIEVDLASMTQTLLKEKVARYLAYAADRAWEGLHPYCPPMLLLTTTATRAATFARAAGQLIAQHEDRLPFEDPTDVLVVAACGHVHNPARAIAEACWKVPEAAAADLTLADLLSERLDAQAETEDRDARDAAAQRQADLDVLRELREVEMLADWLDSRPAAEALDTLIGTNPAAFLEREPDLADQVLEWGRHWRRIPRSERRQRAEPLVPVLEARHPAGVRARIGLAGQYAAVNDYLSGRENMEMVGLLYGLTGRETRRRAAEVFERMGLAAVADRQVGTYSGGPRAGKFQAGRRRCCRTLGITSAHLDDAHFPAAVSKKVARGRSLGPQYRGFGAPFSNSGKRGQPAPTSRWP